MCVSTVQDKAGRHAHKARAYADRRVSQQCDVALVPIPGPPSPFYTQTIDARVCAAACLDSNTAEGHGQVVRLRP